ncbi:MAG: hypothetical protein QME46_00050 [Thermoanaerobacteraceae bacterium]|nr:hypothetical protein [Thermoanaerobacteraceae bacterium]
MGEEGTHGNNLTGKEWTKQRLDSTVEAEKRNIQVSNETFEILEEYSKKVGALIVQVCEDVIGKYI